MLQAATVPANNIAFALLEDLSLVVLHHAKQNPTDAEWTSYVELLKSVRAGRTSIRILVHSVGGHPTRAQQSYMSSILQRRTKVAVISPSVSARFVTSILVLTNPDIRCFSPQQQGLAYAHLGLTSIESTRAEALSIELKDRVGS